MTSFTQEDFIPAEIAAVYILGLGKYGDAVLHSVFH